MCVYCVLGDHLSFQLSKSAQESQADNLTAEGRLEGLISAMGDFHTQMNQLDVVFGELFDVSVHYLTRILLMKLKKHFTSAIK